MNLIEEMKRLNLVDFLAVHYAMTFQKRGGQYACRSPFSPDKEPSFFVRQVSDGHWLFKDFSNDHGGSIIDFVLLRESLTEVSDAISHIRRLSGDGGVAPAPPVDVAVNDTSIRSYDIQDIYRKLRDNDLAVCRDYLLGRGIAGDVVADLEANGMLLHNRYRGRSYCCFAVFDQVGTLCCLDNHQVDGEDKFVLGPKACFTKDWDILPTAERVFVSEGIIDYLSMKTLYQGVLAGIALLGNMVRFSPDLLANVREIISALDGDGGGLKGLMDLYELFPDKEITITNFGAVKDANAYLQSEKSGSAATNLTAQEKLSLYKDFMSAENKTDVALKWGVNRSYMYQIVKECDEMIVNGFSQRRPGRKRDGMPATLDEAMERIDLLEEAKRHEAKEKERYYARSEFMKVRLKCAEIEAAELRGVQEGSKKQIKKNERRNGRCLQRP